MKKYIYIIGVILLASICQATAQEKSEARAVLDRVAEEFLKSGGAVVNFNMHYTYGDHYQGKVYLKNDKFLLDANGVKTWYDGKTQWTYLAANDEVNISEPTAEEVQGINPYAWLSLYKRGYKVEFVDSKLNTGNFYHVRLCTDDTKADIRCIHVVVERKTYYPASIRIVPCYERDEALIAITSYRTEALPDAFFRFDKREFPQAEVIDLR